MRSAVSQTDTLPTDWREALLVAFDLGLPRAFDVEWLLDRAERGQWGGLWW